MRLLLSLRCASRIGDASDVLTFLALLISDVLTLLALLSLRLGKFTRLRGNFKKCIACKEHERQDGCISNYLEFVFRCETRRAKQS